MLPTATIHSFSGNHYEIGIQQGKANRELLRTILERIPKIEAVKKMKPRLLPASVFLSLAKRRAVRLLEEDITRYYPKQAQRLKGISEGSGIGMSTALFLQAMELLIRSYGPSDYRLQAYTALGFSQANNEWRDDHRQTLIIRANWDLTN